VKLCYEFDELACYNDISMYYRVSPLMAMGEFERYITVCSYNSVRHAQVKETASLLLVLVKGM